MRERERMREREDRGTMNGRIAIEIQQVEERNERERGSEERGDKEWKDCERKTPEDRKMRENERDNEWEM